MQYFEIVMKLCKAAALWFLEENFDFSSCVFLDPSVELKHQNMFNEADF